MPISVRSLPSKSGRRRATCRRAQDRRGRRSRPASPRRWPRGCAARSLAARTADGAVWVRGCVRRRPARCVSSGRSPPAKTLTRPSSSMWTTRLASTRRKLSARGLPISRLVPAMPTSAFGARRHHRAARIAHHDVAQPHRGAPVVVAFELGAADLDAVAAAEILLDRGGEPRRRDIERDRAAGEPPPHRARNDQRRRRRWRQCRC